EFGLMSRVLAPKFGGHLTFASLRDSSTTAPGQPTIRDLLDLYRFRSINPATGVFGVVGWPVSHSLSPHVHNAAFEHAGLDAVYLPLPIAAADDSEQSFASLKATLLDFLAADELDLAGLSVTLPHKEGLVSLARDQGWVIDDTSSRCGAANTLIVAGGGISICNTDASAALACLKEAGVDPAQSRIVIIGAGGVGRTLAIALADAGAHVLLANRTLARAQGVADHAAGLDPAPPGSIEPIALDDIPADAHAYMDATSLGMPAGPEPEKSALDESLIHRLPPGTVLFDTVYRRGRTPMLEAGNKQGLRCVGGLDMFVRQGAAQFESWTNRPPPVGLIERVATERLAE
ncbi:MAG: type I 3-dehydroquinate dehydratase, partial [Planctomycetes bacterium]|nr:type I 3-dehydroquinate dehydratase [Planctomycetota bacterium]